MRGTGAALLLVFSFAAAGSALADSSEVAAVIPSVDARPVVPSVGERLAIIRERIQSALEYPPLARLRESGGDALVRFEIDHSGVAREIRVTRSSGYPLLDASAVRAVRAAEPLPWVYGPLEVPVRFEFATPR
jgi:TonB family protein